MLPHTLPHHLPHTIFTTTATQPGSQPSSNSTSTPCSPSSSTSNSTATSSAASSDTLSPDSSAMTSSISEPRSSGKVLSGLEESRGEDGMDKESEQGSEARRGSGSAQMNMAALTVEDIETKDSKEKKMRRASTVSSSSGSASGSRIGDRDTRMRDDGDKWGKGERDPSKPARRKAARIGSFESARGGGRMNGAGAGNGDGEGGAAVHDDDDEDDDDEDEQDDDEHSSSSGASAPNHPGDSSAPSSSNSRPPHTDGTSNPLLPPPPPAAPTEHVDIVSYPSSDLLRLLASLLEQIARANDALNQRTGSGPNTPARAPDPTKDAGEDPSSFERGRFDAAPLNSPVTPRYRSTSRSGVNGEGADYDEDDDLPVTPGVDLQREIGERGGVAGFMPSLGGAHAPVPLARRRGSSFLTKREREGESAPMMKRGSSGLTASAAGSTSNDTTTTMSSTSSTIAAEPPLTSLLTASSLALASPSATLCFHARNVPAISIEAYLLRILKYCPTTNEVFLSLLVYFDRMARVGLEAQRVGLTDEGGAGASSGARRVDGEGPPRLFAIDSFNIHRLVIAGVTVASKFFSDVFYTNSRYAKVGGLPLNELNQLELQFLLLNDFRLVIPLDELQRYADQLILFWIGRNGSTHPASSSIPLPSPIAIPAAEEERERPGSVRSQPSSSGTSVTSTITPGTPSTPKAEEGEDEGDVAMDE